MNYYDSVTFKYNTDMNGNPISIQIVDETQQVSPITNFLQLVQIPDEFYRLIIRDENDSIMKEVFDVEKLSNISYKVDYSHGLVHFHQENAGKTFKISYYGRGVELIHASRIVIDENPFGFENLQQLADKANDVVGIVDSANKQVEDMIDTFNTSEQNRLNVFVENENLRQQTFMNNQAQHTQKFNQAQDNRQSEFDSWRDIALDENANINLQNQINQINTTMVAYREVD